MCRLEGWSVRTLRSPVRGMLFERTAISRRPEKTIQANLAGLKEQDRLTTDLVFRRSVPPRSPRPRGLIFRKRPGNGDLEGAGAVPA